MYSQNYRFRIYDVDKNKYAKPAALIREMQDCGDRQMYTEKPSYDDVFSTGRAIMLNRLDMVILKPIRLDEIVKVMSWPCPGKRATFLRCYGMWRSINGVAEVAEVEAGAEVAGEVAGENVAVGIDACDGMEQVAHISSQWSLVDLADRKILPINDDDFSNYTYGEYTEVAPGKFKIPRDIEETMELVGTHKVCYSDADCNGHMNNTYYLDVLCDNIPELETGSHRVSDIRLHYSKEAVIGDSFEIYSSGLLPAREGANHEGRYLFKTVRLSDGEMNIAAEIGIVRV